MLNKIIERACRLPPATRAELLLCALRLLVEYHLATANDLRLLANLEVKAKAA